MKRSHFAMSIMPLTLITLVSTALCHQPPVTVTAETVAELEDGTKVEQFTMTNSNGLQVSVINYGATITQVQTPDGDGNMENVTLHFDDMDEYLKGHPLFGSIVGRYANRIANASFSIDGQTYALTPNAGKNHIHGGQTGFQRLIWDAKPLQSNDRAGVRFAHVSPDGNEGYPGKLDVKLHYLLTADNQLILEYWASTDKPTHVNLTNHAYWNLGGVKSGDVLKHVVKINASRFLEANPQRFPSGRLLPVEQTPMDFRTPHAIGERIEELESQNYDDCYVIDRSSADELAFAAHVEDPNSGRTMDVYTTAPGVQFYTAKGLNGRLGAKGVSYGPYHGLCLETQHFPDSPNQKDFPSTLLRPDETYHQKTVYRFGVTD